MVSTAIQPLICSERTKVMVTVRELVALPDLGLRVVGDDGFLDRQIEGVHTSDLPRPSRYLLQGELVLTNGLWFPEVEPEAWVSDVAGAGVAALGFGLGSPHPSIPDEVVTSCERHLLPLLEIPEHLSFVTIADSASAPGAEDQRSMLRRHLERARAMVQAMTDGRGPAALLDVVREATGRDAALVDTAGRVVAATAEPPPPEHARSAVSLGRTGRLPAEVAPGLTAFGSSFGHRALELVLLVAASPLEIDDEGRAAINQVTDHLELHAARHRSSRGASRALTHELVERARDGTLGPDDHRSRMAALGLDPTQPVLALAGDHEIDEMDAAMEASAAAYVSTSCDGATVILAQALVDGHVGGVAAVLEELGRSPTIGVGTAARDPEGLGRSIAEALIGLGLARSRPLGDRVVGLGQIGSVSTLLAEIDPHVLRSYRGTLLEPLERWDAERGAELVGTVRSFLEHGCRWRVTAAALHIHHNTLRYRLKRVEELTGRDLGLVADRLDLQIALLVPQ